MKKTISYIICTLCLLACGDDVCWVSPGTQDAVPLAGIEAEVYSGTLTRAPALEDYVGRSIFAHEDQMVLTSIKRTLSPISSFSYKGIVYNYLVESGQTAGSWNRDDTKGSTEADPNTVPVRIYWSDAASAHTYIGYSLPKPREGFTWNEAGGTYTGRLRSVSSPTTGESASSFIDHTTGDKIKTDDLLLTYDKGKLAETGGSVAKLYFYHALANVRVIVNISGFSANDELDDVKSHVHDMVLKDMPIDYQWDQTSHGVTATSGIQKMDTHMWIPITDGAGTGVGRKFTFYALAVPRNVESQTISFKVTYPDPMKPDDEGHKLTNTYQTEITGIEYRAGYCTTINITLNHKDENITVGAEYMDWQYVETPDQSELKKNSTMLREDMLDRDSYTLLGDDKANADDATWLYVDPSTQKIVDIYGHDGSSANPFVIATAQQLVAFANEVKGTGRTGSVTYKNLSNTETTLAAGESFDFTDYYVKLDADIVLQPELMPTDTVTWCGVGDDTHVFNGKFLGGRRTIRCLYGSPFFVKVGAQAVVEQLNFMDVIEVDGRGIIANESRGLIAAVFANGPIRQKEPTDKSIYSGSLVGTVEAEGVVISCAHFGDVEAWADANGVIGGLVGYNKGLLLSCYHSGKEKNLHSAGYYTYAGVGKHSDGSYAFSCYYNIDADPEKTEYASLVHGKHAFPVNIGVMQSEEFVTGTGAITVLKDENTDHTQAHTDWINKHLSLNHALDVFKTHVDDNTIPASISNDSHATWYKANYQSYKFTYTPGEYPRVQ